MARIAGINIPPHKHAEIGLTAIYGIGRTRARQICDACGIVYSKKIKDLTDADLEKIRDQIAQYTIEGDFALICPDFVLSAFDWTVAQTCAIIPGSAKIRSESIIKRLLCTRS